MTLQRGVLYGSGVLEDLIHKHTHTKNITLDTLYEYIDEQKRAHPDDDRTKILDKSKDLLRGANLQKALQGLKDAGGMNQWFKALES